MIQRRTFLSWLAIAIATIAIMMGSGVASAQITQCASGCYRVDLSRLGVLSPNCFPLRVITSWNGGTVVWPSASFIGYPGAAIYTECPPVPVGAVLDWIEVCGKVIPAVPGQQTVRCGNCTICINVCLDSDGCLYIQASPGPCPQTLLPCP